MKKLITGAIAAAALLFGFASCTGLHDNATQPLKITGNLVDDMKLFGEWLDVELVTSDGSEQKYEFTATAGNQFKLSTAGSWATDIAGDDINSVYPVINGDYIDLHSREAEALPNTQNVVINDMTVGEKYVMLIKYNPTTKATSVKITGSAVVMPALDIVVAGESKNFPAKDKDGNDLTYTMKRSGTEYTYQFIASETETVSFHLESATAGLTYGGATLTSSDTALTVYSKTDMSTSLVKDHEYKLTVKVPSLTAATIKAEEVSMLKNTAIYANWKYAENFYEAEANDSKSEVSYLFFAENTALEFVVNRVGGTDYPTWGAGTTSSVAVDGSELELKYFDGEKDDNGKVKEEKKNVKVTGLRAGTWYYLDLKVDNRTFAFSVDVKTAPYTDLTKHAIYIIETTGDSTEELAWGNQLINPTEGLSGTGAIPVTPNAVKVSDSEYYFDFDLTGKTLSKGYCTIAIIKDSWWGDRYETPKGSYKVGSKYEANKLGEEPNPRGLVKLEGKKYRLTVTLEGPVAYFQVDEQ